MHMKDCPVPPYAKVFSDLALSYNYVQHMVHYSSIVNNEEQGPAIKRLEKKDQGPGINYRFIPNIMSVKYICMIH